MHKIDKIMNRQNFREVKYFHEVECIEDTKFWNRAQ